MMKYRLNIFLLQRVSTYLIQYVDVLGGIAYSALVFRDTALQEAVALKKAAETSRSQNHHLLC